MSRPTKVKTNALCVSDEYTNRIPNPKHMSKYTKAKVQHTQDKHMSALQSYTAVATTL